MLVATWTSRVGYDDDMEEYVDKSKNIPSRRPNLLNNMFFDMDKINLINFFLMFTNSWFTFTHSRLTLAGSWLKFTHSQLMFMGS
jgi:hypothetical protein